MSTEDSAKPKAFVLMPFGESFDELYALFIKPTLGRAGYDVNRADDMRSSQNILKDIINGIATSDLILADLTESNPNVYYELGLAHALCKPTVLLTQAIEDLPFDLRSYRVISYSTYFADLEQAKPQIEALAEGLRSGNAAFGGPVTDFAPWLAQLPKPEADKNAEEGDLGMIDHLATMEEGLETISGILTTFTEETSQLTEQTNDMTSRMKTLSDHPDSTSARQLRSLVMVLGQKLSDYSKSVASINNQYSDALGKTRASLETAVRSQDPKTEEERRSLIDFLSTLDSAQESTQVGLTGVNGMTETLRALPSVERTFNRARSQAVRELQRFSDNIEQTKAMMVRTKEIGELKIKKSDQEGAT